MGCPDSAAHAASLRHPPLPASRTHDYVRHGTTLFAALEVATGKVTDACYPATATRSSCASSSRSPSPTRGSSCTSWSTTTPPTSTTTTAGGWRATRDHAARHPDVGQLAQPRGDGLRDHHPPGHPSPQLHVGRRADRAYTDAYNDRCDPFVWTTTADDILANSSLKQFQRRPLGPGVRRRLSWRSRLRRQSGITTMSREGSP